MASFTNDGTSDAPKLRVFMNLDSLAGLGAHSIWSTQLLANPAARDARLAADGFDGVQLTSNAMQVAGTLPYCGLNRINAALDADAVVASHAARGDLCLTVHVGTGLEDSAQAFALVQATIVASQKHGLPVFVETHRATVTQDLWRTVEITRHCPDVRFNGDLSHYYCGQEMAYGDWDAKLAFMQPIFERVGFLHGRVASPGCMQVPISQPFSARPPQAHGLVNYQQHFQELWAHAVRGFLHSAGAGDVLIFAPELLDGSYYYARQFPGADGELSEECDRYAQAMLYQQWIRDIFSQEIR